MSLRRYSHLTSVLLKRFVMFWQAVMLRVELSGCGHLISLAEKVQFEYPEVRGMRLDAKASEQVLA